MESFKPAKISRSQKRKQKILEKGENSKKDFKPTELSRSQKGKQKILETDKIKKKHGWEMFILGTILGTKLLEPYNYDEEKKQMMTRADQELFFDKLHYDKNVQEKYSQLILKELHLAPKDRILARDFLAKQVRHDKCVEVSNERLYEIYKKGTVSIMYEVIVPDDTNSYYFDKESEYDMPMFATIIGHLCDYIKPEIKKSIADGKCTYNVTKDNFIRQKGYHCVTCYPQIENHSICESCANKCHKGHKLIQLPKIQPEEKFKISTKAIETKSHMFCDCGANLPGQIKCKCL